MQNTNQPVRPELVKYQKRTLKELEEKFKQAKDAEKRNVEIAIHAKLRQNKAAAYEFEVLNDRFLQLFQSTGGYYKMIGVSILLLKFVVAPRIEWNYNLRADDESHCHSEEGVISFRHLDSLIQKLDRIDVKVDKNLSTPERIIFRLPRTYSQTQLDNFRVRLANDIKALIKISLPESPNPDLFLQICYFNQAANLACAGNHKNKYVEEIIQRCAEHGQGMVYHYTRFAKSTQSAERQDILLELIKDCDYARSALLNLANIQSVRYKHYERGMELAAKIRRLTQIEIKHQKGVK